MPTVFVHPAGRVQVFSRHGTLQMPDLVADIPASGVGVQDPATKTHFSSVSKFLLANNLPKHLTLRYIEGPLCGKTLSEARSVDESGNVTGASGGSTTSGGQAGTSAARKRVLQARAYVPGRVQVHTRSGYPKEPAIYGTIPPDGSGIIDDCAGRIYDSPRAFCIAHSQPANYILVYTDGALKGRRIVQLGSSQAGPITGDQGAVAATASAAPKQPAKAKATKKPAKAKPGGQPAAKRQLLQPLPDAGAQKEEMEVEVGCDYTLREV